MSYSNKPQQLHSLLKEYLGRLPRRKEMKRGLVLHLWPGVVGQQMARATKDLYFENNKLIVRATNEAWRNEIHMNRFSIAKKLNKEVDGDVVKSIVVRS